MKRVAWLVALDDMLCVVYQTTRAKAKWVAVQAWREVGYGRDGRWPHVSARRYPQLDDSPLALEFPTPYTPEHAKRMAKGEKA